MARSTDLLHELTTGKPPALRGPMSARLRARLRRRWARDVLALIFAGAVTITLFLLGGLTLLTTIATMGVAATPIALIAATFALRPKPVTRALEAAPDKDPDDA